MRNKLISLILTSCLLLATTSWSWAAQEPQIIGEAAVLIDAQTGQVLYGKEERKRMFPASTTKVLTALVALKKAKLTDNVTIGPNPINAGGTSIWLAEGEQLTLEELLYALLLNSANDAGVAIAEYVAGSVEKFAELSNQEAKALGAGDTHFTNPHGMPDKDHYTTAYNLALIARQALKNEDLRKIITTVHHEIPRADPEAQKYLFNHNKLLWSKTYGYKGATGLKTGYTVEAGQCIIASAERDGRELIAVVLRSEGFNIWTDAAKILDYGFANFHNGQLVQAGKIMANLPVKYGKGSVDLKASADFNYTFPVEGSNNLQVFTEPQTEISAPVTKGQVLGEVLIKDGKTEVGKVSLVAANDVERDWLATMKPILYWTVPPVILLLLLRRRIQLRNKRKRRLARRTQYYYDTRE